MFPLLVECTANQALNTLCHFVHVFLILQLLQNQENIVIRYTIIIIVIYTPLHVAPKIAVYCTCIRHVRLSILFSLNTSFFTDKIIIIHKVQSKVLTYTMNS